MVTTIVRYAPLAIRAAKVLHYLARLYGGSTQQEREAIKDHLQEIWEILENVAERSGEVRQTPALLMLLPGEIPAGAGDSSKRRKVRVMERSRQVRQNVREFAGLIRRYQSNFTSDEAKEVISHLNEIRKTLADINRRTRR
jgi:hypothetical protein